jgi:hypothetical protein
VVAIRELRRLFVVARSLRGKVGRSGAIGGLQREIGFFAADESAALVLGVRGLRLPPALARARVARFPDQNATKDEPRLLAAATPEEAPPLGQPAPHLVRREPIYQVARILLTCASL